MTTGNTPLSLEPGAITLVQLRAIARDATGVAPQSSRAALSLAGDWRARVQASADTIARIVREGNVVYGVNTGFGKLATTRIPDARLAELQVKLTRSHAAGVGPLLDDDTVRLVIALKAASLARGYSGVRPIVIDTLMAMLEHGITPCIPSKGSVGASGDLAPLAHLTMALIGEGEVRVNGVARPASEALSRAGVAPLALAPKEGLALLNGTQVSCALALMGLFAAQDVFAAALAAGALSTDAAMGSDTPFDARIHAVRGHAAQSDVARVLKALLEGSAIRESHREGDEKVQDPYSLRCQPQVMGACLEMMRGAARTLEIEANGVSDNPLVFADAGEVLSGGNFHAEPVAFAADQLALVLAEIGSLAERRIAMLTDTHLSGLPPFLTHDAGVNSGFMIAHVTAAALASENKALAHPRSVDSIPTSANQEDHVSMATGAALRLIDMADNAATIVAIELLAAAQGIDFRRPLATSPLLENVMTQVRQHIAHEDEDRYFAPDIERARNIIRGGWFRSLSSINALF